MSEDITLIKVRRGRVYYYGGNIYQPFTLHGDEIGKVKRAIREFFRDNTELVKKDRLDPKYKTLLELCDEQFQHCLSSI